MRQRQPINGIVLDGREVYVEKISAAVGYEFSGRLTASQRWEDEFEAIIWLLSKALCDAAGTHFLDSDQGRAMLREIDFGEYNTLVREVCQFNGYHTRLADDKKN